MDNDCLSSATTLRTSQAEDMLTRIGRGQVDAHTSRPRRQQKDRVLGPRGIECIHRFLPLSLLDVPVETQKLDALAIQKVFDYSKSADRLVASLSIESGHENEDKKDILLSRAILNYLVSYRQRSKGSLRQLTWLNSRTLWPRSLNLGSNSLRNNSFPLPLISFFCCSASGSSRFSSSGCEM
jgi:hypothetical protein